MPKMDFTGGTNAVTQSVDEMNQAAEAILNGSASEPVTPAATSAVDNTVEGPKYANSFDQESLAFIGRINSDFEERTKVSSNVETLRTAFDRTVSICGYLSRYPEKIDFKKKTVKNDSDATIAIELALTKPRKPYAAIVRYSTDLATQLDNASNFSSAELTEAVKVAKAAETADEDSKEFAYTVAVLKLSGPSQYEFFDWVSHHTGKLYIQESPAIQEKYQRLMKDNTAAKGTTRYKVATMDYSLTGGKPGVYVKIAVKGKTTETQNAAVDRKGQATGKLQRVVSFSDIRDKDNKVQLTYVNTGRPGWVNHVNTLYDKKYDTVVGSEITQMGGKDGLGAQQATELYFKRFFKTTGEGQSATFTLKEVPIKKETADGKKAKVTPTIDETSPVQFTNMSSLETLTANVFTPEGSSFWSTASVPDWYDVTGVGDSMAYKTITGNNLKLVMRFKNEKGLVKESIQKLSDNPSDPYNFEAALAETKIPEALNGAKFDYATWLKVSSAKSSKSTSAKSTILISDKVGGLTLKEINDILAGAFSAGTDMFG